MSEKKIVLLGGSGFIGAALAKHWESVSKLDVEVLNSATLNLLAEDSVEDLSRVIDGNSILVIASRPRRTGDDWVDISNEFKMSNHIARALLRSPVKRCIYLSSTAVYGDERSNLAIAENAEIAPSSTYGMGKYIGECNLRVAATDAGIPLVILRPCMVYGPGGMLDAYGPNKFIASLMEAGHIQLFGEGSEIRDYIYISDMVEIVTHFVHSDDAGIFNVSTGQANSFREIVQILQDIHSNDFELLSIARNRPQSDTQLNSEKLKYTMSDITFTDLRHGLLQTYRAWG